MIWSYISYWTAISGLLHSLVLTTILLSIFEILSSIWFFFCADFVYVSLGLTKEPLYKRNLISFGPTNLRATLCYSLVHLTRPKPGDVLLDHMCGGASISIEVLLFLQHLLHFIGINFLWNDCLKAFYLKLFAPFWLIWVQFEITREYFFWQFIWMQFFFCNSNYLIVC